MSQEPEADPTHVVDWPALRRADWERPGQTRDLTRPEQAAEHLAALSAEAGPDERLGTKEELRLSCGVSVGTFNEALRLAQSRGVIDVRAGRTGGVFARRQSPLMRLGNSVLSLDDDATSVADAVQLRDALDPLLIADAVRHAGAGHLIAMGRELGRMEAAVAAGDGHGFIRANWALHARIAETSPNAILRSVYLSLLEIIESHTLAVQVVDDQPLAAYLRHRYEVHAGLVEAVAERDLERALHLLTEHNAAPTPASSDRPSIA